MKKYHCVIILFCVLFITGCGKSETLDISISNYQNGNTTTFVSGMGCNNPNCTDSSHHHDCSENCTDYSHYHNCDLNCTDVNHHHDNSKHTNSNTNTNKSGHHNQKGHHRSSHH